jgi:PBSX family phage terminase large subunit
MDIDLDLTHAQYEYLANEDKFCLFSGGIGSGKTFIGAYYVLKQIAENPRAKGFIGANTYKQLHNSTLSALFRELEQLDIPYIYKQNKGELLIGDTEILCMSLENYQMIRGIEIGWFWLDEVRDTKEDAFRVLMGRLRDPRSETYEGRLTSSPSGFNWLYDFFVGDKKTPEYHLVQASSMDNPFLPEGYVDTLKASYDEKVYQQEVLGQFINIAQGRVYYGFDRQVHVKPIELNNRFSIYIGMDFNVNPMTASVCQYIDGNMHVIDEIYMMSSNTNEMAEEIKRRYGCNVQIIPDATGRAIKTSAAGLSDHEILRRAGLVVCNTSNPFRMDRYNAVNNLFEKGRVLIDPKCVKLTRDLEQLSYKEGSTNPDVGNDKTLGHISDAFSYAVWYLEPIERPRVGNGMIPRRGI